jgi:acyl-coenzyme A thioesterase PaaI-like protein
MQHTNEIFEKFRERFPEGTGLKLPPPVFLDMRGEVIRFDEEVKALTIRFPVQDRFQNPMGLMQGGMIVAAIDNTFGPLSYLVAPPSVTTQLNTSFIQSVPPDMEFITVTARVDEHTRRFLYLSAKVNNPAGEILAIAQASFMILRGARVRS